MLGLMRDPAWLSIAFAITSLAAAFYCRRSYGRISALVLRLQRDTVGMVPTMTDAHGNAFVQTVEGWKMVAAPPRRCMGCGALELDVSTVEHFAGCPRAIVRNSQSSAEQN